MIEHRPWKDEPVYAASSQAGSGMVGGTHYKKLEIDPWMVIRANGMGYFDGNALKYIMRFRHKDGLQDLKKARHYLEELIRQEEERGAESAKPALGFCDAIEDAPHTQDPICVNWRPSVT